MFRLCVIVYPVKLRICCLGLLVFGFAASLPAQLTSNSVDDLLASGEEWLRANLDDDVLAKLGQVDRDRVEELFRQLQRRYDSEYVLDLPALKDAADTVLTLLEAREETQPYAAWLKARLDYFEVANALRNSLTPPPLKPGEPPRPLPLPTAEAERAVWNKQFEKRAWPEAASNYISQLKPIFVEQNVPPELVWVAEVESSFDPRARSPAGAVGLFQLMPDTARGLGLSLWPWDERKRPVPSARAAAKYLHYLYGEFHDWRLALAAYNAGEGRVSALLKNQKARSFDEIAGKLPAETQMFVPKVEAVLLRREGVELTKLKTSAS